MQALEGIRVVDLSRLLPGPFCSLLLADFGADVIKVEDPRAGDYTRWTSRAYTARDASLASATFVALNRNKRSVQLDLKRAHGREVLLRLVRDADILLESFRPGVLEELGVGYRTLRQVNPRLVYCGMSGYERDGSSAERAGHDINYLAAVGVLALSGERDGPPAQAAVQIADFSGALTASFAILAALRERDRSGEGQMVDVSLARAAFSWLTAIGATALATGRAPRRGEVRLAGSEICYRPYRCADGWVALGALEQKFWEAWCRGVGRPDLIESQREPAGSWAHAEVERIFAERSRAEWGAFAARHDCCLEPVLELEEALAAAGDMVVETEQPGAAGRMRQIGPVARLSRTPADPGRRPAPGIGEHTAQVLAEIGYSRSTIEMLARDGSIVLREAAPA